MKHRVAPSCTYRSFRHPLKLWRLCSSTYFTSCPWRASRAQMYRNPSSTANNASRRWTFHRSGPRKRYKRLFFPDCKIKMWWK